MDIGGLYIDINFPNGQSAKRIIQAAVRSAIISHWKEAPLEDIHYAELTSVKDVIGIKMLKQPVQVVWGAIFPEYEHVPLLKEDQIRVLVLFGLTLIIQSYARDWNTLKDLNFHLIDGYNDIKLTSGSEKVILHLGDNVRDLLAEILLELGMRPIKLGPLDKHIERANWDMDTNVVDIIGQESDFYSS